MTRLTDRQLKRANKNIRARRKQGQTIVVALLVLLILAGVGALFITIIARNIQNVSHSTRVTTAGYYAEAGLRFADDQLTNSPDGADWRPPVMQGISKNDPDYSYLHYDSGKPDQLPFTRYNMGDGRFLIRITYNPVSFTANGTPANSPNTDTLARYIKIESIGREGTVDTQDPTTYQNSPPTRLAATLVAYKPIGITDYARFETNPDNRSDVMNLGVPSVNVGPTVTSPTVANQIVTPGVYDFNPAAPTLGTVNPYPVIASYGAPDAYILNATKVMVPNQYPGQNQAGAAVPAGAGAAGTYYPGGGAIRANGSVRFFGVTTDYLNTTVSNGATPINGYSENIAAAGDIILDNFNYSNDAGVQNGSITTGELYDPFAPGHNATTAQDATLALLQYDPANTNGATIPALTYLTESLGYPSASVNFSTFGGILRDGENKNDSLGIARNVNRLEPPTIDTVNPSTNLTRYQELTMNSVGRNGIVPPVPQTAPPTLPGPLGLGQYIYIDNTSDVQKDSSVVGQASTLVNEWLTPGAKTTGINPSTTNGWQGDFYTPPGVEITLGETVYSAPPVAGASLFGIHIVRSDVDPVTHQSKVFYNNNCLPAGNTMDVSYYDLNADVATNPRGPANRNHDIVIYAEGNVRVHGVVSPDNGTTTTSGLPPEGRHVTIITNGTAYIDGSILRGTPQSSVAILARDYVCVNTTQFLAGTNVSTNGPSHQSDADNNNVMVFDPTTMNQQLVQEFNFGLPENKVSGGASATATVSNQYVISNPAASTDNTKLALYYSAGASTTGSAGSVNGIFALNGTQLTNVGFSTTPSGVVGSDQMIRDTVDISLLSNFINLKGVSFPQDLTVNIDPNPSNPSTANLNVQRVAVLPMDVRIEAVLFAENKSFFVIPGPAFNTDNSDRMDYGLTATATNPVSPRATWTASDTLANSEGHLMRFPFYDQPIDLKITIYGSVSEARPADIGAQAAWMKRWGWIPQYHGSLFSSANMNDVNYTERNGHWKSTDPPGPSIGLNMIYNPLSGYPYDPNSATPATPYLRYDYTSYTENGVPVTVYRPLPAMPKLPVCAGLIYSGQTSDLPQFP